MVNSKEKNSNNELKKNPNPEIHFPSLLLFIQFQNPVAAWTWKSRPYMAEKAVIEILTVTKQILVSWKAHVVYCSESVILWRRYLRVKKQWNWVAFQNHLTGANTWGLIGLLFYLGAEPSLFLPPPFMYFSPDFELTWWEERRFWVSWNVPVNLE